MSQHTDILTLDDVKKLVDTFYASVRKDELIGPIFNNVIKDKWPEHLAKLYTFWETILLGNHTYFGSPFPPHSVLPIEKPHFDRWLLLFGKTLDNLFSGPTADEARYRAGKMAEMFQFKLSMHREHGGRSLM